MSTKTGTDTPLRVLVADDESAIREAYGQVFGEADLRAGPGRDPGPARAAVQAQRVRRRPARSRRTSFEAISAAAPPRRWPPSPSH